MNRRRVLGVGAAAVLAGLGAVGVVSWASSTKSSAEDQQSHVNFDAFFANVMFHEVAHGLGIKRTIDGKGTVRAALKEQASALEEGKADILDVAGPTVQAREDAPYDPALYQAVYERLLVHRHAQTLLLDTALPAGTMSAYDFRMPTVDVLPAETDAARAILDVEASYPDAEALRLEIDAWYRT
jgi:cyanate lyase